VKIEQALEDSRYGDQNTDGSHSIRSFYDAMRVAGSNCAIYADSSAGSAVGVSAAEWKRLARCSPLDEPQSGLRRTREGCGEIAGPKEKS